MKWTAKTVKPAILFPREKRWKRLPVDGFVCGGLAIHPRWSPVTARFTGGPEHTITHVQSGYACVTLRNKSTARKLAESIIERFDMTRTRAALQADTELKQFLSDFMARRVK